MEMVSRLRLNSTNDSDKLDNVLISLTQIAEHDLEFDNDMTLNMGRSHALSSYMRVMFDQFLEQGGNGGVLRDLKLVSKLTSD